MAVALVLAVGIVAIDLWPRLPSRRSTIAPAKQGAAAPPKRQAVTYETRLDDPRLQVRQSKPTESEERLEGILIAPDRKTFNLTSTNPAEIANATVTVSGKMRGAVMNLRALPLAPTGRIYDA